MIIYKPVDGNRRLHAGAALTSPVPVEPAFERGNYTEVTIIKTGPIGSYTYINGSVHLVDDNTRKILEDAGQVAPASLGTAA